MSDRIFNTNDENTDVPRPPAPRRPGTSLNSPIDMQSNTSTGNIYQEIREIRTDFENVPVMENSEEVDIAINTESAYTRDLSSSLSVESIADDHSNNEITRDSALPEKLKEELCDVVKETILGQMCILVKHNEESLEYNKNEISKMMDVSRVKAVLEFANLLEKYSKILTKVASNPDFGEEYKSFINFKKNIIKSLNNMGVEVKSVEVGTSLPDVEECVDVAYVDQCLDESMWGRISELVDSHYYVLDGKVIKPQKVGISGKEQVV